MTDVQRVMSYTQRNPFMTSIARARQPIQSNGSLETRNIKIGTTGTGSTGTTNGGGTIIMCPDLRPGGGLK
jgi:hypothetical protein